MTGELQAIKLVGGVLPASLLGRIQSGELNDRDSISPQSYFLVGSEQPRDAASRAWSYLRGAWAAWRAANVKDATSSGTGLARDKWLLVLLGELGFGRLPASAEAEHIDGVDYPISHRWNHVPVHLLGPRIDLDKRNKGVAGAARAPQAMLQEYLNRVDENLWGILSNGIRLRLLRDSTALAGSAYVEFDLEAIFDGELYAEFLLLWQICHVSRVAKRSGADAGPEDCWLEAWRAEAVDAGARALDRLREGVEAAIIELGSGFLASNGWLRAALFDGSLTERDYHKALLRLIYRLLFAFVAEDRGALLAPDASVEAKARYVEYFSTSRLRKLSRLRSGGKHPDLWRSQRMILLALGGDGLAPVAIPALGGLFDPDRRAPIIASAPHRDLLLGAELTNLQLLSAIRHLAWIKVKNERLQPIDYRHLGAEELGSVYESLLELVPSVDVEGREFTLKHLSGNERKTTGSYYTPPSLVSALLDSALDPVLDEAIDSGADAEAKERNLLALTVCDPASGSGGFLVAAARRIARRVAQVRSGEDEPTPAAVQSALHDVVARCIYGVDMNDLAAELAKVSLWLEALEPGKPLGFLDARIRIGNSLFGATPALLNAGVPDDAFKEIDGDDKKVAASVRKRNRIEQQGQGLFGGSTDSAAAAAYASARRQLTAPTDDLARIRARGAKWEALMNSPERRALQLHADAWAAAFVWPLSTGGIEPPTTGVVNSLSQPGGAELYPDTSAQIDRLARDSQFFHWHLEFPEVFDDPYGNDAGPDGWSGGFSCMLGNPPWERVKLQEQEFFASRDEEIAKAPNAAARKRLITALKNGSEVDRRLHVDFLIERRRSEGVSAFLRRSGRYPLNGRGDVNTYAIFAELFRSLTAPGGRSGVIVPTGIATDATTQYFFRDLVETETIAALYDFENSNALFDGVHRSFKFCILSTAGRKLAVKTAYFAFFLTSPLQVESSRFTLTPSEIILLNPNTGTVPIFRTRRDAEITLDIYRRMPVLINENDPANGNPWGLSFLRMFDMSTDSHLFYTGEELEEDGWTPKGNTFSRERKAAGEGTERMLPLYEAKMLHQFDHRWSTYAGGMFRDASVEEKSDPEFVVLPRYWVEEAEVVTRAGGQRGWLAGWRNIARATDVRTTVASAFPFAGVGHSEPTMLGLSDPSLVAILNSFASDYVARQKVGGVNFTYHLFQQLAIPTPSRVQSPLLGVDSFHDFSAPRIGELSYVSWDSFELGGPGRIDDAPFRWDNHRRSVIRAELDAATFLLFGVGRDDADYIMDTFPIVERHDISDFGEYRTKRLILENYDAMKVCIDRGTNFVSTLDPAPGFGPRHPERNAT
ncbi:N-6 DNA methylase [Homoserinimonas sp. OAct 916]|uniref:Eco57I restriction-modification methylase domain-containing protein n=1 Tax=Homoserinimonas sp. OAct 916 TaxID=2211450 RepID=UPI000DBE545E|nr:N-6 DNA methylase [Homoserinimonas sp. OAct 916]